jgi:hypothetical protein
MPTDMHIGKLTEEVKFMVTPQLHDLLSDRARQARCTAADLARDALYLVLTEGTFTDHVANDRRAALRCEGQQEGVKGATK